MDLGKMINAEPGPSSSAGSTSPKHPPPTQSLSAGYPSVGPRSPSHPLANPQSARSHTFPPTQQPFTPSPINYPPQFQAPGGTVRQAPPNPANFYSPTSSGHNSVACPPFQQTHGPSNPATRSTLQSFRPGLDEPAPIVSARHDSYSRPIVPDQPHSPPSQYDRSSRASPSAPSRTSPFVANRQLNNPVMSIDALSSPSHGGLPARGCPGAYDSPPSRRPSHSPYETVSPKSQSSAPGRSLSRLASGTEASNVIGGHAMSEASPLKRKKEVAMVHSVDDVNQAGASTEDTPPKPVKKKQRYDEPPLWARKAPRTTEQTYRAPKLTGDPGPPRYPAGERSPSPVISALRAPPGILSQPSPEGANGSRSQPADHHAESSTTEASRSHDSGSLLGPWEHSIINVAPFRDITRQVADFIFENVYRRPDAAVPEGQPGPKMEIEAKLGHIVDQNTNRRLALPVTTECILSERDPALNIRFESRISEAEFSRANDFLNDALRRSTGVAVAQVSPRLPIKYTRREEIDDFFLLGPEIQQAIPPSVRRDSSTRSNPRLRITTATRTGNKLASIVKMRVRDLHLYNPTSDFDCRISVSMEMDWSVDLRIPLQPDTSSQRRKKDRLSYQHLAYSIDLTKVSMDDRQTYELEIEMSADKARELARQAEIAQRAEYEILVKSFLDNIRILSRSIGSA